MGSSSSKPQTRFESLNDDTLTTVLEFVGRRSYRSFGGVNKRCKEIYVTTKGLTKETFLFGYGPLSRITNRIQRNGQFYSELHERVGKGVVLFNRRDVLDWALYSSRKNKYVIKGICNVAGEEGRIDILDEVWNSMNNDDDKRDVFHHVDVHAARGGKLDVLKWLETKGLPINKYNHCARYASRFGQLHILQWLQEEKGWKVSKGMYHSAADGDHLHVMKWLREQSCPWGEYTFMRAAKEGNMSILQWLHNEGCPWLEGDFEYFIHEEDLKPEVIEWLRANGYGNRIISESDVE